MTEKKKQDKVELRKELAKTLSDLEKTAQVGEMLKNNEITFKVKEDTYKVRKPNYDEQMEIEGFRRKKYLEFINDDTMLFRKEWVEKYKKKGVDIDKMEQDMINLQNKIEIIMLKLAKTTIDKDVEKQKDEILELKDKQLAINIEKTDLLSYSIEDQLTVVVNSYFTYIVLEKQIKKEKWEKVFKDFKEFSSSKNNELINKAFYFSSNLIYDSAF